MTTPFPAAALLREVRQRLQQHLALPIRPRRAAAPAELWQVGPAHQLLALPALAEPATDAAGSCPTLLVYDYVPGPLGARLRAQGQYYADAVGNAWLQQPGLVLSVRGCARPRAAPAAVSPARQVLQLRVLYLLLLRPELAACPLLQLAACTGLPAPAVKAALEVLSGQHGGLAPTALVAGGPVWEATAARWAAGYAGTLRRRLNAQRYRPRRPQDLPLLQLSLPAGLVWGGEGGARRLLALPERPGARLVLHSAIPRPRLLRQLDLVPDPCGPLEILNAFAPPGAAPTPGGCAPPLLVYADLLATAQPGHAELAALVWQRYLGNAPAPAPAGA